jgi:hypothetical protein
MSHTELRWARRRKIKSGMVSTSKVLQWRTIVAWQGYDDIYKTPTPHLWGLAGRSDRRRIVWR